MNNFFLIILILLSIELYSQNDTLHNINENLKTSHTKTCSNCQCACISANAGFSTNNNSGFGAGLGISYSRIIGHQKLSLYGEYNSFDYLLVETSESMVDFGFLYGYSTYWKPFLFDISTGISFNVGNRFGSLIRDGSTGEWGMGIGSKVYEKVPFFAFGIPYSVNFDYAMRKFAYGISFHGNINYILSYYGMYVHVKYIMQSRR